MDGEADEGQEHDQDGSASGPDSHTATTLLRNPWAT